MLKEFDYETYPFLILKTENSEIIVLQVNTGKSQKVKVKSGGQRNMGQTDSGGLMSMKGVQEMQRMVQIDSQHLMIVDDSKLRLLGFEFDNLKDIFE